IDRSGSMNTRESDGRTRLDHAKEAASDFLRGMKSESRAMVIAFADRAEVACAFTNDVKRLADRIDEIRPTDGSSRIAEALQLAVAYSTRTTASPDSPDAAELPPAHDAHLELFSDGRIADAENEILTRGELTFHRVGAAADNVGIVAFDVRRDIERPGVLAVFAQVENFGSAPITTDVSLSVDGALPKVQEVSLGPAKVPATQPAASNQPPALASAQNLIFELESQTAGLIEIKVHRGDALEIDNVVQAPMDPPRRLRVLCVSDRPEIRYYMQRAFKVAFEIDDYVEMSASEYETSADADLASQGRSAFDLVIIDKHDTDRLWPGNYLFFGGIPKIDSVSRDDEEVDEQVFVNWRDGHPLLRHVPLDKVVVLKWQRLNLPEHALPLIEGENTTVMAFIVDPGHRYVISAFDILESNFHKRPAMIIFLQNAISHLAAGGLTEPGRLINPGDTIALQVPPGASEATLTTPDGRVDVIDAADRQVVTYARTESHGLYRARFNDPAETTELYAANVLDPLESMIQPAPEVRIGSAKVQATPEDAAVNRPLLLYAIAVALMVLLIEWWVYNKRVMI
ncbi:MAG TPA: VWA domain-containing protein, partial [Phycisphaerae bacterium]|nr:VWA domain-containing protein [Phycisphaerae bacterium]